MENLFLFCIVAGGGALLVQLALGLFGLEHGGHPPELGLELFSVRSCSTGLGMFGLAGLGALHAGGSWPLALSLGLVLGVLSMGAVAWLMRALLRLESDGTLRLGEALGRAAKVYIPIPGGEAGQGRITFALQERTVELPAVTGGPPLPTGAEVTIVDVREGHVLEVVLTPHSPEEG
jgi:hypothetical protein